MPSSRSLAIVEAIVRGDATFESIPVELWRRQYREHALAEAQRTEDDDDGDEDGHLATHELTRLPPALQDWYDLRDALRRIARRQRALAAARREAIAAASEALKGGGDGEAARLAAAAAVDGEPIEEAKEDVALAERVFRAHLTQLRRLLLAVAPPRTVAAVAEAAAPPPRRATEKPRRKRKTRRARAASAPALHDFELPKIGAAHGFAPTRVGGGHGSSSASCARNDFRELLTGKTIKNRHRRMS